MWTCAETSLAAINAHERALGHHVFILQGIKSGGPNHGA
jgi:hypothetical protein